MDLPGVFPATPDPSKSFVMCGYGLTSCAHIFTSASFTAVFPAPLCRERPSDRSMGCDSGNGDVQLPFGSAPYVGLGMSVFVMLVLIEVFGSPFMRNCQVRPLLLQHRLKAQRPPL